MKKTYIIPNMEVIAIKNNQHLLAGSAGNISNVGTNGSNITSGSQFGAHGDDCDW